MQSTSAIELTNNTFYNAMASGLLLWSFTLLIPTLHLGLEFTPLLGLLSALPIAVLVTTAWFQSRAGLIVLFIPSLLPAILVHPQLVGPRVYGSGAFLALCSATLLHLVIILGSRRIKPINVSPLRMAINRKSLLIVIHTAVLAILGITLCYGVLFYRPFRESFANAYPQTEDSAKILVSLVMFSAWMTLVWKHLVRQFGDPLVDKHKQYASWYRFEAECTDKPRVTSAMIWSMLVGVLCIGLLVAVLWLSD